MASNFVEVIGGLNLGNLASDPSGGKEGDFYTNSISSKVRTFINGAWREVVTNTDTQTLTNKTVNGGSNTLSNISDTSLNTIVTAGKVSNSATTATNANTASTIVARDGSGNFSAGVITATVTGNITGNVTGNVSGTALNITGVATIANGGTGQTTANTALNALLPSQTSQASKILQTDGTNTSWTTVGSGTVTSVQVAGSKGLSFSGGPVTTSGTITASLTPPTVQKFTDNTTGSTTYIFVVTSANATAGAVYTNNAHSFTVLGTISGSTFLFTSGGFLNPPTSTGTLTKSSGTGDSTITFSSNIKGGTYTVPSSPTPLYIKIRAVGAGGGGGGSGTASQGKGGDGGTTYFGNGLFIVRGGLGGSDPGFGSRHPGTGGAVTIDASIVGPFPVPGGGGLAGTQASTSFFGIGGGGGNSALGGGGIGNDLSPSVAPGANTGGGGGGAASAAAASQTGGGGGGGGGYAEGVIANPTGGATYAYAVGVGGTAGAAGTSGTAGAAGSDAVLYVEEHYQ